MGNDIALIVMEVLSLSVIAMAVYGWFSAGSTPIVTEEFGEDSLAEAMDWTATHNPAAI